jgi:hypothetical protein
MTHRLAFTAFNYAHNSMLTNDSIHGLMNFDDTMRVIIDTSHSQFQILRCFDQLGVLNMYSCAECLWLKDLLSVSHLVEQFFKNMCANLK